MFETELKALLEQGGNLIFLWAFLGGILSTLTPCVYPLIPITLALFGVNGTTTRKKAFLLSLCYVGGICVTYTTLGLISAWSGKLFGSFLSNIWVSSGATVLLFLLGLYTLDLFSVPALAKVQSGASKVGGTGFFGAFAMGAASGLVAAPCVGPVLLVILSVAATSQNPGYAALLLLSYSLGLGMLFLVLGTFSGAVSKLPRSGNWFKVVKFVLAVGIFFLSVSFIAPRLPVNLTQSLAIAAPYLVTVAALFSIYGLLKSFKTLTAAGAILLSLSLFGLTVKSNYETHHAATSQWQHTMESALQAGSAAQKPVMVDLFAEWCGACKELDAQTFPDATVQETLTHFALGRVDFTIGGAEPDAITEKYKVLGLPCILFLNSDGSEIPDSRITGFMKAEEFTAHLKAVLKKYHE